MKPNIKKLLILNAPYLLFVYLFDKVGQAVRLSPGADLSGKLLSIGSGFSAAFSNALPSFAPMDLLIGIVGAVVIRLAVYVKGKNAKKYRKGMEYGSARWGNAEDIKPYIDPMFENNVLLTQTERLMMSSRPKHPKYARNKNVLVIGGSGSGKTRFFVKPNLMQMHSSYAHCARPGVEPRYRQPRRKKGNPLLHGRISLAAQRRTDRRLQRGDLEAFSEMGRHTDGYHTERQRPFKQPRSREYL